MSNDGAEPRSAADSQAPTVLAATVSLLWPRCCWRAQTLGRPAIASPIQNRPGATVRIDLSTMSGQCLNLRIPDRETLEREVAAWEAERNALGGPVNWRFTTEDARVRLKRLYPSLDG